MKSQHIINKPSCKGQSIYNDMSRRHRLWRLLFFLSISRDMDLYKIHLDVYKYLGDEGYLFLVEACDNMVRLGYYHQIIIEAIHLIAQIKKAP